MAKKAPKPDPGWLVDEALEAMGHWDEDRKEWSDRAFRAVMLVNAGGAFDDFLDHGEAYLKAGRKDPAGVIAGVVLEDTIRRICRITPGPRTLRIRTTVR